MKFRDKLIRFMYGRYGFDAFSRFLLIFCVVLSIVNMFFRNWYLSIFESALMFYLIFRIFSRNIYKRRQENERFVKMSSKLKGSFKLLKNRWKDRGTHIYRKCPSCKATLRLPREKGKHTVKCPKCSNRFNVNVL